MPQERISTKIWERPAALDRVAFRGEKEIWAKFNRTQIYADNRRNKKDAMRIALSAKRLSVYICVQKGISYTIKILNYIVTSNHVHLLVADDGDERTIPESIQLIAGKTGQEYNRRKNRKGAFWEDRYHATAVLSISAQRPGGILYRQY